MITVLWILFGVVVTTLVLGGVCLAFIYVWARMMCDV